jgi:hypothetical protein
MMAGLLVGLLLGGSTAAPVDVREQADPMTAKEDLSLVGHPTWGTDAFIHAAGMQAGRHTEDKAQAQWTFDGLEQHAASKKVQIKQMPGKWAFAAAVAQKAVASAKVSTKSTFRTHSSSPVRKVQVTGQTFPAGLQVSFSNCDPCLETEFVPELDGSIYTDNAGDYKYYGGAQFKNLEDCKNFLCANCGSFSSSDASAYQCTSTSSAPLPP